MINNKKVMALIPARGGSKGIKNKNIKELNGLPLIAHTIKQAKKVECLDEIIVSTDDDQIKKTAIMYGAKVPFRRPAVLSHDTATNLDVTAHALENIKCDMVVILQPTSPLRKTKDIYNSIKLLFEKNIQAVISVCKVKNYAYSFRLNKSNIILDANTINKVSTNRQDHNEYFTVNGAIYAAYSNFFMRKRTFFTDSTYAFEMPFSRSVDIDDMNDWVLAEKLIKIGL